MTFLSFEVVGNGVERGSDGVQGSMLDFDSEMYMGDPCLFVTGGDLQAIVEGKHLKQLAVGCRHEMVPTAIELAYLFIQVSGLGGILVVVDEASSLFPYAFKEAPEATDQSYLEALSTKLFLGREAHGVVRLHRLSPMM